MVIGAFEDRYDTAILVSSDTDLIPAIKYLRHKKKKLEYIGFSHAPSYGLIKNANKTKLLSYEDVEQFKEKTLLD